MIWDCLIWFAARCRAHRFAPHPIRVKYRLCRALQPDYAKIISGVGEICSCAMQRTVQCATYIDTKHVELSSRVQYKNVHWPECDAGNVLASSHGSRFESFLDFLSLTRVVIRVENLCFTIVTSSAVLLLLTQHAMSKHCHRRNVMSYRFTSFIFISHCMSVQSVTDSLILVL